MKVLKIEETPTTTGSIWLVTLAKNDGTAAKPMLREKTKPTYEVGHDIYASKLVLRQPQGQDWYYEWKEGATSAADSKPRYQAKSYSKDDNAIMVQVAFKGAIECEGYWYVPDGKSHTDRVIQNTDDLVAGLQEILKKRFPNPVVAEAVKMGAKVV